MNRNTRAGKEELYRSSYVLPTNYRSRSKTQVSFINRQEFLIS